MKGGMIRRKVGRRGEERSQSPLGDRMCLEAQAKPLEDNLAFSEVGAG